MRFEIFIASRMFLKNKANFSQPIVRLGAISVALGLAVMTLSIFIVTGFQQQVREKVIGFGSHIVISAYETNTSLESTPLSADQDFYPYLDTIDGIKHIQIFATKAGIIKTDNQIEGLVFKGIGGDFDWDYFDSKIISGESFRIEPSEKSTDIIVSKSTANRLNLHAGEEVRMYFINNDELKPRGRKFTIVGIFETGLEEFDRMYVLGDIKQVQQLNNWTDKQISGFEILINNYEDIDKMGERVNDLIGYNLRSQTIKELQPQIFEWLDLHDMNVFIIIALMILVAGITMISTLLILILEKTSMIGILKALGTKNMSIQKIFLYNAIYIIGKGLIWGNLIAIGLSLTQLQFGIFKLNQESYYVSEVPINFNLMYLLFVNVGTIVVCALMLIVPTYIVTRIKPIKAIRFR
ncbi:MAG: ABC transporter permease [Bacteroidales bacterium]|nr:ABC transporter permease [Bacteroidales bacterium]MCF8404179.1 ABC transporter permease [Bacteroidales bacterium]